MVKTRQKKWRACSQKMWNLKYSITKHSGFLGHPENKKSPTPINNRDKKETQVKEIGNMFNRIIKGKPSKAGTFKI